MQRQALAHRSRCADCDDAELHVACQLESSTSCPLLCLSQMYLLPATCQHVGQQVSTEQLMWM